MKKLYAKTVNGFDVRGRMCKWFKRAVSVALTAGMVACSMPGTVAFADNKDIQLKSGSTTDTTIEASFTITEADLNSLGYSAIITVPISFSLKYDKASKAYKGSVDYYVSGILSDNTDVQVYKGTGNKAYKVFRSGTNEDVSSAKSETLIDYSITGKYKWTPEECRTNMETRLAGGTNYMTGQISVEVPLEAMAAPAVGEYYTVVPVMAAVVDSY